MPGRRMLAVGSPMGGAGACAGERLQALPPRMCSSASVSPKRSGGAATVPLSSRHSFARKDSLKVRPFSFSLHTTGRLEPQLASMHQVLPSVELSKCTSSM